MPNPQPPRTAVIYALRDSIPQTPPGPDILARIQTRLAGRKVQLTGAIIIGGSEPNPESVRNPIQSYILSAIRPLSASGPESNLLLPELIARVLFDLDQNPDIDLFIILAPGPDHLIPLLRTIRHRKKKGWLIKQV